VCRPDAVGEQGVLAPQELQRVRGERFDLHGHQGPGLGHGRLDRLLGQRRPLGDNLVAEVQRLLVQPDHRAVGDLDHHVRAAPINDRDARVEQQLRAEVRVPAGDAHRGVDDRRDLPPDQLLGADPVQVGMIDDGDLARIEPTGDDLRPAVHARDGDDAGWLPSPTPEYRRYNGRQLH
jgi:hypothetical protein